MKAKQGRPTTFSQDKADLICARLADGDSLRKIVRENESVPSMVTIFNWLHAHPEFLKQYARAKEEQADALADEIQDIADENPQTVEILRDGEVIEVKIDTAFEAWRKTRIDARKWIASKLKPKKYGDKLEVDARVSVAEAIVERLTRATERA